ncbi:MAG: DUF2905 domain-containing protein [Deltaproteobacteria bacterium]|nr:DUF2905 domain-containing protein [Deltaproteobacteria bacterium]
MGSADFLGRLLTILGGILLGLGLLLIFRDKLPPFLHKIPLGRLPGDIVIKRPGFTFYFPLASSVIVSALITLLYRLLAKK